MTCAPFKIGSVVLRMQQNVGVTRCRHDSEAIGAAATAVVAFVDIKKDARSFKGFEVESGNVA